MSTSPEKTYHHGELGTALVTAALSLLAESGTDAVSLRAVARRAGVSAMAPYRHYPDKESLLAAVATQGFDGLQTTLQQADAAAPQGQALVAQAVAYVRYALDHPALFRLMFGPRHLGNHPHLSAAGDSAYAVLANRVAVDTPNRADQGERALGCWAVVHGLAFLFLDGRIGDTGTATPEDLTRAVALTLLQNAASSA